MKRRFLSVIIIIAALAAVFSAGGFSPRPQYRLSGVSERPYVGAPAGEGALPSYYNSRDLGYVSGVDDQGGSELCWAFGHNELLEISLAKKYGVKYDFSEEAMKFETSYFTEPTYGFMREPNDGGNEYISTAYLARTGSVLEADEPFSENTETRAVDGGSHARVGRLVSVPMFLNPVNNEGVLNRDQVDQIKRLVMEYGAVGASLRFERKPLYQTARRHSYYYDGPALGLNHFVTVIGWDDSFPASEFAHKPAGDGAFIVKNSYGLYHDDQTSDCVYISYYDKYICSDFIATEYETDTSLYDNVYQYDYMGWISNVEQDGRTLTAVNRFVADTPGEKLTAVSTYIVSPGTEAEVLVSTGGDLRDKNSYRTVAKKTFEAAGYYVIPVEETVIPGHEYRVAVRITSGGKTTMFPVQLNLNEGMVDCSAALPNTCYIGKTFAALRPVEKVLGKDGTALCIKAFTKNTDGSAPLTAAFGDVPAGSWYEAAVSYAAGAGLFSGTGKTTFSPQTVMTRAMFVRVLANLSGVDFSEYDGYTGYIDVPRGKWYSAAVLWASEKGVVNGITPNTFGPDKPVSRQQMCVMLLRFAKSLGYKFDERPGDFRFSDDELIQDYAKSAVYTCRRYGIISGVTPTEFSPRAGATRAQAATLFKNFCTGILF